MDAEALENPSEDRNTLKLCALCDLRGDKSLVFSVVPVERERKAKRENELEKFAIEFHHVTSNQR